MNTDFYGWFFCIRVSSVFIRGSKITAVSRPVF